MEKVDIETSKHSKLSKSVAKALHDLEIDPKKKKLEVKEIIALAKKMGYAISPSQATEALFCAKGDIKEFQKPFNDEELDLLVQWFAENKNILRSAHKNYMKFDRKAYNASVNMKPKLNTINDLKLDQRSVSGTTTPKVITPFSPKNTGINFNAANYDENTMRYKIRETIDNIKRQVEDSLLETNTQRELIDVLKGQVGSEGARKRLISKNVRHNRVMKKNISKPFSFLTV
jgi:hypothetical protein